MLKEFILRIKTGHLRALHEQKGQSLIIFTFAILGLIAMLGLALDLGLVYVEQVKIGRTIDAATLAGVVELPFEEDAMRRTIEFIELNGYQPGVDTRILVRGCVDTLSTASVSNPTLSHPPGNVSELGAASIITTTNIITGALARDYITADEPRATFVIDTLSHQAGSGGCNPSTGNYGTANKLEVSGQVNVRMNFMQFFGWRVIPVEEVSLAENITNLDVVVVFDVSGSMEMESTCYDCWVRTDEKNPDYPTNGYFNPLPYNPEWADSNSDGVADVPQSIAASDLCTVAPDPHLAGGFRYLVHESELYSREVGDWSLGARTQGQGFWVLQRGSRNQNNAEVPAENGANQGNRAGSPSNQSSNVCNPGIQGTGVDCTIDTGTPANDDVCRDEGVLGNIAVDCSAYIKAHPFATYGQYNGSNPKLQGASYDLTCWNSGSGTCWTGTSSSDPSRPNATLVPYVEYDFTPDWSGNTHIWIRAIGGSDLSTQWHGLTPASHTGWRNTVLWDVVSDPSVSPNEASNSVASNNTAGRANAGWQDNRAINGEWGWVKLGSRPTSANIQYTLRIFQGSAGYKIDKIIFTNDSGTPSVLNDNSGKGPAATNGSATRESCNICNPAFGYTVDQAQCGCPANSTEALAYNNGAGGAPGTGLGCSAVITGTNQLEDHLYRGVEPLRSAQEAVKNFARRLDPQFDQIGIVAFSGEVKSGSRRAKLQCIQEANAAGNAGTCYDPLVQTNPISFTKVLEAVEEQWPDAVGSTGGTDIAEGLREGLQELGVVGTNMAANSDCTSAADSACDRRGAARKVLILMTDGAPNKNPGGGCNSDNIWNGDAGNGDADFECAVFFGREAANAGIIVYTIGIGAGVDRDLLTAIAEGRDPHSSSGSGEEFLFEARGGRFFNAAKPTDLDAIFTQILGNIYVRIVG